MKKITSILLLLFFGTVSQGQTYTLVSHLDGWVSPTLYTCPSNSSFTSGNCPSYTQLCVHSTCSAMLGPDWGKIGSPSYGGSGQVNIVSSDQKTEGLFTYVNFVAGKTYKIHIGISSFDNMGGSVELYAVKQLAQTAPIYPSSGSCACQEPSLWNISTNSFNATYWSNSPVTDGIHIGSIKPATMWSGITKDYVVYYHAPASPAYNQFAVEAFNAGADQVDVTLDYVVIEEDCGAAFSYTLNTGLPEKIEYHATGTANTYNWDYGDGNTGNGANVNHTYGNQWLVLSNYTPCLDADNGSGTLCRQCVNVCIPQRTRQTSNSCEVMTDFSLDITPYTNDVVLTPWGGPSSFGNVVDWGDGTFDYTTQSSWSHHYAAPGSYTVCLTQNCSPNGTNGDSKTCLTFCLPEPPVNNFDGNTVSEDEQAGMGNKKGTTSNVNVITHDGISLSPNPTSALINIEFASEAGKVEIRVVDMLGKTVIHRTENLIAGKHKVSLDMSQFQTGIYTIEVEQNGQIRKNKIVKE